VHQSRLAAVVVALSVGLFVGLFVGSCGHDIGDSCKTAADCDPNGTRTCDLSQPGGYCTMAGCDEKSCPSGAVCIRYFPENLLGQAKPCTVQCEDVGAVDAAICPNGATDDCTADELCLNSGLCAKRSYETRSCAYTCGGDGDCRGGYQCWPVASTGIPSMMTTPATQSQGMMLLGQSPTAIAKVCAPKAPPKDDAGAP
jgi:hypothetical protein